MLLKNYYFLIITRIVFIVFNCIILGIILSNLENGYYYTLTGLIILLVLQTWMLLRQVNKTNTDLEKFISSVSDNDSSIRFPDNGNKSFKQLHDKMNAIIQVIQSTKIENEKSRQMLQGVVDHVNTGLLSFDAQGRVGFQNKAAHRFINTRDGVQLSFIKYADDDLYNVLSNINPGQEVLYKLKKDNSIQSVLIKATGLISEGNKLTLVSFEDITSELDRKELDSWQRLIRVLTHEIMNSVSPITSLTSVIAGYFRNKQDESPVTPESVNQQVINKTLSGLSTIEETGKGLLDFVDKYRSLTLLPAPRPVRFSIDGLFQKCKLLMESGTAENIEIITKADPVDISLTADQSQVEQVLINLVKNSVEAIGKSKNGKICLSAIYAVGSVMIQVEDNGPGIPDSVAKDIFVPFFTTKENGSGIGLSLSRQIMQNHKGTISVNTETGKGAMFILRFPDIPSDQVVTEL